MLNWISWFLDYYWFNDFLYNNFIYIVYLLVFILLIVLFFIFYWIFKNIDFSLYNNKSINNINTFQKSKILDSDFSYQKDLINNISWINRSLKTIKNIILIWFIWSVLYFIVFYILPLIWVFSLLSSLSHNLKISYNSNLHTHKNSMNVLKEEIPDNNTIINSNEVIYIHGIPYKRIK